MHSYTCKTLPAAAILLFTALMVTAPMQARIFAKALAPDQQRTEIRAMRDQALAELYATQPSAEGVIESAAGYATSRAGSEQRRNLQWAWCTRSGPAVPTV